MMTVIQVAETEEQILACFPVLLQLRPHLQRATFVSQIQRQQLAGYQLAFLEANQQVVAVAGFRLSECLAWGKFLYVDDLIVDEVQRSKGYGQQIFQWLIDYARTHQCEQFHLDSGVQRSTAHRFYFQQRLSINSYHFGMTISPPYKQ